MTRRPAKFYRWTARLPIEHTDGLDVWAGWSATREMSYQEALTEARAELVACLGNDFAHLQPFVLID